MTKYLFELTIVTPEGVWRDKADFEDDFSKYLEAKGLQAVKIMSKDRVALEVIPKPIVEDLIKKIEKTIPEPPKPPQNALGDIFANLARAKSEQKKIKVFKESIL